MAILPIVVSEGEQHHSIHAVVLHRRFDLRCTNHLLRLSVFHSYWKRVQCFPDTQEASPKDHHVPQCLSHHWVWVHWLLLYQVGTILDFLRATLRLRYWYWSDDPGFHLLVILP